jgi:hypothetical protein
VTTLIAEYQEGRARIGHPAFSSPSLVEEQPVFDNITQTNGENP